jgi:hypothetical protein
MGFTPTLDSTPVALRAHIRDKAFLMEEVIHICLEEAGKIRT